MPSLPVSFCSSSRVHLDLARLQPLRGTCGSTKETKTISDQSSVTCAIDTKSLESAGKLFSPVLVLPGLGNSSDDYKQLSDDLKSRGHQMVSIAPVQRWQWGLNAKGLFMADYWRSELKPNAVLEWYFDMVDRAVAEIMESCDDGCQINVLGHSAGGWLGRAYIAERAPSNLRVSTFLTLGTPHMPPPRGRLDQTRGLLRYIEANCDVSEIVSRLVCVAGRGKIGKRLGEGSVAEFVAYLSYSALCGSGNVDGDGVTPINAACCTNGELVYCDNCDHSMLTSSTWYGSEQLLYEWVGYLT